MRSWYNSKNKVKNKRGRTGMKKGLRPSEKKEQYSGWTGTKIFRGVDSFKNSVSKTNLNSRLQ